MFRGEEYKDHFQEGHYACKKCKSPLFSSDQKYKRECNRPVRLRLRRRGARK
jgi:peptide methionine sulfoxide reductase MsrB